MKLKGRRKLRMRAYAFRRQDWGWMEMPSWVCGKERAGKKRARREGKRATMEDEHE